MKARHIAQAVIAALLLIYVLLLHNANSGGVVLPFFFSLPVALVVVIALGVGWLLGWLPSRLKLWGHRRELRRMERKVAELEQHLPSYDKVDREFGPVIPDRSPDPLEPEPQAEKRQA